MSSGPRLRAKPGGAGGYRVLQSLGQGGMADVQLVLQTTPAGVERLAVIKRARPELAQQAEYAAMFWEEARIAATLSHQNVVQTYEVGHDDNGYFLILEFLRGQSYAQVITRAGYEDYRFSLEVLLGTVQGLEYAHGLKQMSGAEFALVHRDISPPNVFVTYDGQIKVLDFGIAKARGSMIQTEAGVVKGKVAYMAPEQMLGAACDFRADLYAVGVMLWEATAGQPRFAKSSDIAISDRVIAQRAPLSPGAVGRGLPALADEICRRALAHDPQQRYSSAAALHDDLERLAQLAGGRLSARAVGQYVSERFAKELTEQQARIEADLDPSKAARQRAASAPDPLAPKTGPGTRPLALDRARVHARPVSDSELPNAAAGAAAAGSVAAESEALNAARFGSWKPARVALLAGLVGLVVLGMKLGASLSGNNERVLSAGSAVPIVASVQPALRAPQVTVAQPLSPAAAASSSAPPASAPSGKNRKMAPKPGPHLDRQTTEAFGGRR